MNFCQYLANIDNIDVQCSMTDGYESLGWIVSRSDVDFASIKRGYTGTSVKYGNNVITQLALKDSKKGYFIKQLKQAFADTTVALQAGDYRNTFTQNVSFKIFGTGPKVAEIVNGLANDELVVILEQKEKGVDGESAFRIFGLTNGLVASATDQNQYDEAIGAGWSITLTEEGSTNAAEYLFISTGEGVDPSYESTKQAIDAMFDQPV